MGCARACSAAYLLEDEVSTFVALFALCRRLRPVIAKCPKRATPGLAWGLLVPIEARRPRTFGGGASTLFASCWRGVARANIAQRANNHLSW